MILLKTWKKKIPWLSWSYKEKQKFFNNWQISHMLESRAMVFESTDNRNGVMKMQFVFHCALHVPEMDVWNFTLHEKQMLIYNIFKIANTLMDLRNEKKLLLSFC